MVASGTVMVLSISLWRYRVEGERIEARLGERPVELDGKVLVVDGQRLHLEPGWLESAEKVVALNAAAA